MLLFGIVFLSLGSVNNVLAERFHLDNNAIGTLTFLLPFGILAGSLIFGPIVDRFGYKWLLTISAVLVFVGLEGIAFAASADAVKFFVFLIGFGGGVLNGATNALVADISAGERGANLSLLGVFFGLGALGMPGTLAALSKHFSQFHIVAGIGAFVWVAIFYFLFTTFPPAKQQKQVSLLESLAPLKHPALLVAGILLAFQSGMEGMSNDWMTRVFKKVILAADQNTAEVDQKALFALTMLTAAMVVTRSALGWLLRRMKSHYLLFASFVCIGVGALIVGANSSYSIALAGVVLTGVGLSACFPVVLGYIGDLFPENSGTAFSGVFIIALLGNMGLNKTLGFIAQSYGVAQYTNVVLGCVGCAIVLLFLLLNQINKHNPNIIKKQNEQPRETMVG